MGLKTGEIVVLVLVILMVLSASRMGALGNALGRFVYSFRKAARGQETIDVTPRKPALPEEDAEIVEAEKGKK